MNVKTWSGAALALFLLAAPAAAQTVVPQYTHRGVVTDATFDADDARVALGSSGGFVSVVETATGRVLAVRRVLRSNETHFMDLELDGDELRFLGSIAGEDPIPFRWRWTDDVLDEGEPVAWPDEPPPPATDAAAILWTGRRTTIVQRGDELFRTRRADGSERRMAQDVDRVWPGARGSAVVRDTDMVHVTVIRANGARRRFGPGGEHSVWHARVAPRGDAMVLAGRFGAQWWSAAGVAELDCFAEEVLAVDWARRQVITPDGRCGADGSHHEFPAQAMAATDDGRLVFFADGRFFGSDARIQGLDIECFPDEGGGCTLEARFEARGALLVVEGGYDESPPRVFRTSDGREIARGVAGARVVAAGDGSRVAFVDGPQVVVRDADGEELFRRGEPRAPTDDQPGSGWPREPRRPPAAFDATGGRFAWSPEPGVVEVLDAQGVPESRVAYEGTLAAVALGPDAIAVATDAGTELVRGARRVGLAAGVGVDRARCVEGAFLSLDAELQLVRGPTCASGEAEVAGPFRVRREGGRVQVWRDDVRVTFRTIRHERESRPLAHDRTQRWWSPGSTPFVVRQGRTARAPDSAADLGVLAVFRPLR